MRYAKSEETRRKLVKSAAKLLRTRGYAGTGVRDVVEASGVPKGSLYHHFPGGKDELCTEAVRHSGAWIHGALFALLEGAGDPVLAMRGFCDGYAAQLEASRFEKGCPLATVALDAAAHVDPIQAACKLAFDDIVKLMAAGLERGGLDPEAAERAGIETMAAIEGALLLAKAARDVRPLRVVRDQLTETLTHRLEAARAPEAP